MGSKGSVFYNTYVCQTQQTTPWNMEAWPEERLIENLPKFLILTIIITKNQEKSVLRITDTVFKSSKTISLRPLMQAFLNGVHPTLFFASKSIFGGVMKWDFSEIFKQCVAAEIITLFLLRNRFSIIWNITNYGCQAEAREMNYEPDFYAYTVNGDFQSSAAQRYIHTFNLIRE